MSSLSFSDDKSGHSERLQLLQEDHKQEQAEQPAGEAWSRLTHDDYWAARCHCPSSIINEWRGSVPFLPAGTETDDIPFVIQCAAEFAVAVTGWQDCSACSWLLLNIPLTQLEAENEVNNEMANRMSLFYAEATPMLKTLSNATTKFVSEVHFLFISRQIQAKSSTSHMMKLSLKALD